MKKVVSIFMFLICSCCVAAVDTKNTKSPVSNATDYFRSFQTGTWGQLATWESSSDNVNWFAATLLPDYNANTISIRNTHTISLFIPLTVDQLVIESGGVLNHIGNSFLLNDGAGDDLIVQSGGVLILASNGNSPAFGAPAATANINTGGILRVSALGITFAGGGVNASNYIYQHASVLEYTLGSPFSSMGVTFFPNVDAVTIPVFRITTNVGLVGSTANTVFNGLFEANGNISFQFSGTKTFRNGITGTGNVSTNGTSGKFIINGATANLGGAGSLTLPAAGMDVGNNTAVSMISNKTITGNIALLSNALITLGTYDITLSGTVSGGSTASHIVTNSTGKLVINSVGASAVTFPVGATGATYNPMEIFNGGGFNFGVRVQTGINPAISIPLNAVNRTWHVTSVNGTPGTVNTNFFYFAGDANAGFNYSANLELGFYNTVWNVIQPGLIPTGSYQVSTTVNTLAGGIESPLVLANLGAILTNSNSVSVNFFTGIKQNNQHVLSWKLTCNSTAYVNMELQRSYNAIDFDAVYNMHATALLCQQPFGYTDDRALPGSNYYRIKMIDADGNISYSSTISLINAVKGFEILPVAPDPVVHGIFQLKIASAKNTQMQLQITDMQGRVLQKRLVKLFAGFNIFSTDVSQLPPGIYYIAGYIADEGFKVIRFAVQ